MMRSESRARFVLGDLGLLKHPKEIFLMLHRLCDYKYWVEDEIRFVAIRHQMSDDVQVRHHPIVDHSFLLGFSSPLHLEDKKKDSGVNAFRGERAPQPSSSSSASPSVVSRSGAGGGKRRSSVRSMSRASHIFFRCMSRTSMKLASIVGSTGR